MTTPKDVLISGERHLVIHGQFGNLQSRIDRLQHMLDTAGLDDFSLVLAEIGVELNYLRNIYPDLGGDVAVIVGAALPGHGATNSPKTNNSRQDAKIRDGLMNIKALVHAAYLGYTHEGNIDCHLKVMFDYFWAETAKQAGISVLDDVPF